MSTSQQSPPAFATPDVHAIQGNIIGFNKDHERLVFLRFPGQHAARTFLTALEPSIANGYAVREFNDLYKEIRVRRGGERGIIQAAWTNIAFTQPGLEILAPSGLDAFPEDFRLGMAAQAAALGDVGASDPSAWLPPFTGLERQVHAMVIIGADDADDLAAAYTRLQEKVDAHGIVELGPPQDGQVRPDAFKGHEHFGYKDGISQPGIRGLTTSSKNPNASIEPGEFLIGYADEAGHVSGAPEAPEGPPPEAPSSYTPPPPLPAPMPPWAKDGSFLVYRRLRQDVLGFESFTEGASAGLGLDADQLGAKLVGRWKSGAAMEPVPALPAGVDPSLEDPSLHGHPQVLEDAQINDFAYGGDPGGDKVPRAAHVRKTNPRDQAPPGQAGSDRRRILRRGIPYGPEVERGSEQPYGGGPVPDAQDRGLLFLCYQASISRGFAFIQRVWVNNDNFPQGGDGHDPIISQEHEPRQFHLPGQASPTDMRQWVFTTGGDYFFSPSIPALKQLAAGTA